MQIPFQDPSTPFQAWTFSVFKMALGKCTHFHCCFKRQDLEAALVFCIFLKVRLKIFWVKTLERKSGNIRPQMSVLAGVQHCGPGEVQKVQRGGCKPPSPNSSRPRPCRDNHHGSHETNWDGSHCSPGHVGGQVRGGRSACARPRWAATPLLGGYSKHEVRSQPKEPARDAAQSPTRGPSFLSGCAGYPSSGCAAMATPGPSLPFPAPARHLGRGGAGVARRPARASACAARPRGFHPSPTSAGRRRRWGRGDEALQRPRGTAGSGPLLRC